MHYLSAMYVVFAFVCIFGIKVACCVGSVEMQSICMKAFIVRFIFVFVCARLFMSLSLCLHACAKLLTNLILIGDNGLY